MLESFLKYLSQENLIDEHDKTLLGISGGIDSMVMLHLFKQSRYKFSVAHCNFNLREKESDGDQDFVKKYANQNNIEFFIKKFPTKEYAAEHKISIQMAARELRINWFSELLTNHNFSLYATAHHLDDQAETFFINLLRGTGIAGLHGILPKQGNLIHPLLFTNRSEIIQYAKEENIPYREDSSNKETKYQRNKIRHKVIPLLNEIKPGVSSILAENTKRIRASEEIYRKEVGRVVGKILRKQEGNSYTIDISKLKKLNNPSLYLFEIILAFDFNYSDAEDMVRSISSEPGRVFYSSTHRIIRDRDFFLIEKKKDYNSEQIEYQIQLEDKEISKPLQLSFQIITKETDFQINPDKFIGCFDISTLRFPLTIRKWQKGDFFYPLGMNNKKLISDFFTDNKFSIKDKEDTWLLTSCENIVWIIGHRIDNRNKVKDQTTQILKVSFLP